jgi:uncharacterized tellurite resistance protein B-like protein
MMKEVIIQILDIKIKIKMKPKDFKKILFKGAFIVAACDGAIDETEVTALKKMMQYSLYFDGLDYESEIEIALDEVKKDAQEMIQKYIALVEESELLERQEFQLVEVLIKIIEADGVIDDNELDFLHQIKKRLKSITNEKIISKFPNHINLLLRQVKKPGYVLNNNYSDLKITFKSWKK